jgi:hypothetical protein
MADIIQEPLKELSSTERLVHENSFGDIEQFSPTAETAAEHQERNNEILYQKIISQVQTNPATATDDGALVMDAKHIAALEDVQAQVGQLLQLAEVKGVVYAVQVARKLDFYVLDQVHDQLANHFYEKLVSQGMIERE